MMRLRASVQVTGARVDNSFENLQEPEERPAGNPQLSEAP